MEATESPSRRCREYRFPLREDESLRRLLWDLLGVRIPDVQVCSNHTTPWRAFADAYFARSPVAVWIGSRGFAGKTFALGALALMEAITLGAEVVVLGGSGQQSERVYEAMTAMWAYQNAPRDRIEGEPLKTITRLTNGAKIQALTASQKSVRGPHPSRLREDEIDEMDLEILKSAMGQTMRARGSWGPIETQTVLSSTHQHEDGTMSKVLEWAEENDWPIYEWCYHETMMPHGWLSSQEIGRKRTEVPSEVWRVEYDLQLPKQEALAINRAAVERAFDPALGEFEGGDGEYIEIEPPDPRGKYAHGADWGKRLHFSAFVTLRIDCLPFRLVAYKRQRRRPWPAMVPDFDSQVLRYQGHACHDGIGVGGVVDDYVNAPVESVQEVGRARTETLNAWVNAIERGAVKAPRIWTMFEEHKRVKIDDLYGSGHMPDTFQAGALAYRAATRPKVLEEAYVW